MLEITEILLGIFVLLFTIFGLKKFKKFLDKVVLGIVKIIFVLILVALFISMS